MYPPRKPWESQSTYSTNLRQPANDNVVNGPVAVSLENSSVGNNVNPPPVPRRQNTTSPWQQSSYSTPGYGSPYDNPYRGFGHFGGYGTSPYGHSGYGAHDMMPNTFVTGVEDVSRTAFQSVGSVVQALSSVSMMLESSLFAVQNSVRAVASVADQFSHLRLQILTGTISVLRTIKYYFRKLMILFRVQGPNLAEHVWEEKMADVSATSSSGSTNWPIILFFALVIGMPWMLWRVLRNIMSQDDVKACWHKGNGEHFLAEVKFSFQGENSDELSVNAGDHIRIAPKDAQPHIRGWLLASDGERKGLVPANYIKILGKNRSAVMKRKQASVQLEATPEETNEETMNDVFQKISMPDTPEEAV